MPPKVLYNISPSSVSVDNISTSDPVASPISPSSSIIDSF